jgi:hypothetical protein
MHRSGTSAVARGLAALGVYLGGNLIGAEPDNPTGFWEDRSVFGLSERVLATFGITWQDVALTPRLRYEEPALGTLRAEAVAYLNSAFAGAPVWGFKDPRTVRILPFWRGVLEELAVEPVYVVVVRSPLSVALSLFTRQGTNLATAHWLWLVHVVPYLADIAGKPFVVVDYDLFVREPLAQLARIARIVGPPAPDLVSSESAGRFAREFLDRDLRHTVFSRFDFDRQSDVIRLTGEAYLWLYELATDRCAPELSPFWPVWAGIRARLEKLVAARERSAAARN